MNWSTLTTITNVSGMDIYTNTPVHGAPSSFIGSVEQ